MKPLFIILTVISSFFATNSRAAGDVSAAALRSFQKTFSNATEVVWTTTADDLYKVRFILNNQYATAYYSEEGELLAVTRNISSLQLPIVLQADLKKGYPQHWISDLFEVSGETGVDYYVTLENADTKIVLKSNGSSGWQVYQKVRK